MSILKTIGRVNLPNKLTILRILMTPLFVVFLSVPAIPNNILWAGIVFAVASITDFLDGYIARTRMLETPLGQFLDPIADKVLVMSALVCFAGLGWIQAWTVVVILARDFIISGVRLIAVESDEKIVIPARQSGKVKTIITMVTICVIMFCWLLASMGVITFESELRNAATGEVVSVVNDPGLILVPIGNALMYVCVALTVFSAVQYIRDAREILRKQFTE